MPTIVFQEFFIPGFREKLLCCHQPTDEDELTSCQSCHCCSHWLMRCITGAIVNKWILLLFTLLLLTWPYRLIFSKLSSKVYITFIKEITV